MFAGQRLASRRLPGICLAFPCLWADSSFCLLQFCVVDSAGLSWTQLSLTQLSSTQIDSNWSYWITLFLNGVCSLREATYCSNPFEILTFWWYLLQGGGLPDSHFSLVPYISHTIPLQRDIWLLALGIIICISYSLGCLGWFILSAKVSDIYLGNIILIFSHHLFQHSQKV